MDRGDAGTPHRGEPLETRPLLNGTESGVRLKNHGFAVGRPIHVLDADDDSTMVLRHDAGRRVERAQPAVFVAEVERRVGPPTHVLERGLTILEQHALISLGVIRLGPGAADLEIALLPNVFDPVDEVPQLFKHAGGQLAIAVARGKVSRQPLLDLLDVRFELLAGGRIAGNVAD